MVLSLSTTTATVNIMFFVTKHQATQKRSVLIFLSTVVTGNIQCVYVGIYCLHNARQPLWTSSIIYCEFTLDLSALSEGDTKVVKYKHNFIIYCSHWD